MKRLLTIYLLFSSAYLRADELENIKIISPVTYEPTSKSSQNFKSKFKVGIGELIKIDVTAKVKKQIAPYSGALSSYFPKPGEFDAFVDKVTVEGKNSILSGGLNDEKLIKFYEYLGEKLVGEIFDKILNKEGIKNRARRELWKNKLLAPFIACIGQSKNSQYDANNCMSALSASLAPTAGIALAYELSRVNFSPILPSNQRFSFNKNQVELYKACLGKTSGETSDIKPCVLQSMRSGLSKVTDLSLTKTINKTASSPAVALEIKDIVMQNFELCTSKVGTNKNSKIELSKQFINCIDKLTKATGSELVKDQIGNKEVIKTSFSKIEIDVLIKEKVKSFESCIDDLQEKDLRKDSILDTDICQNIITNEITYNVVSKKLAETANESFAVNMDLAIQVRVKGKKLLDLCWNNKQNKKSREECIRKTIIAFSQVVAAPKLEAGIPADLKNKAEIAQSSLKELEICLENQLPATLSEVKDLSFLINTCSNKVTIITTKESLKAKSLENKMSENDTNGLIKTVIEQNFTNCIGSNPTKNQLTDCLNTVKKEATKTIVLNNGKQQIKKQLLLETAPARLQIVEDDFIACADKPYTSEEISGKLDECTRKYILNFARTLGDLKFKSLMQSALGSNTYNDQKINIDLTLENYKKCLDDLKDIHLNDGLIDKVTICSDALERDGLSFVSSNLNTWMTTGEKDAASVRVKSEFASFIPCVSKLLPPSPYDEKMAIATDSILKPVSQYLSQYIEYSPEDAEKSLEEISKKLATDLKDVATNPESKKALIDQLYKDGTLDQFLKAMVRSQFKEAFGKIPATELSKKLKDELLKKENFDKIFASTEGQAIKDEVMEKILKPILLENVGMQSPELTESIEAVKNKVARVMLNSPDFGEKIINEKVQGDIDGISGFKYLWKQAFYSEDSTTWSKVRKTTKGKIAEAYIKENILLPKFTNTKLPQWREKAREEEAKRLVTDASKSYK